MGVLHWSSGVNWVTPGHVRRHLPHPIRTGSPKVFEGPPSSSHTPVQTFYERVSFEEDSGEKRGRPTLQRRSRENPEEGWEKESLEKGVRRIDLWGF